MRIWPFILATTIAAPALAIVVPGTDFAPRALPGVTAAMEPSLAGSVIYDHIFYFQPSGGATGTRGKVQARVLRNTGGVLDFYWCVSNDAASPDAIKQVSIVGFPAFDYEVGWRIDGLGQVAPSQIAGVAGGTPRTWTLTFLFGTDAGGGQRIMPGQTAKCFFIRTRSHNTGASPTTFVRIKSASGTYTLPALEPRP